MGIGRRLTGAAFNATVKRNRDGEFATQGGGTHQVTTSRGTTVAISRGGRGFTGMAQRASRGSNGPVGSADTPKRDFSVAGGTDDALAKAYASTRSGASRRELPESSLADLPEDQRRVYRAVLRSAADGGTKKSLGTTPGGRARNRQIDDLVAEGYLSEGIGGIFSPTQKARREALDDKATSPGPRERTEIETLLERDLGEPLKRRSAREGDTAVWFTPGAMPLVGRVVKAGRGSRTFIDWEGGRKEPLIGGKVDPSVTLYAAAGEPSPTPAKAGGLRKAAARAAKPAPDLGQVASRVKASSSREEADRHLEGMTVAQLKDLAKAEGVPLVSRDKAGIRRDVVNILVGARLDHEAMRFAARPVTATPGDADRPRLSVVRGAGEGGAPGSRPQLSVVGSGGRGGLRNLASRANVSAAQHNALSHVDRHGEMAGTPATLAALEKKGLISRAGRNVTLTDAGRAALAAQAPQSTRQLAAQVAERASVAADGPPGPGRIAAIAATMAGLNRTQIRSVAREVGIKLPTNGGQGTDTLDGLREFIARSLDAFSS